MAVSLWGGRGGYWRRDGRAPLPSARYAPKRSGAGSDGSPSTLWVPGCSFHRGSVFEHSHDDEGLLECACSVCVGRHLRRLADPELRQESRLHSVIGWYSLAQNILARPSEGRAGAWLQRCLAAKEVTQELRRRTQLDYGSPLADVWTDVLG